MVLIVGGCTPFVGADDSSGVSGSPSGSSSDTTTTSGSSGTTAQGTATAGSGSASTATPSDASTDATDPDDGSSSTTMTTTGPPPECGNRTVEPGEECDDGNEDDSDACSNRCVAATCRDGIQNQGELTADCGLVCETPPTNTITNGDFEMDEAGWQTENAEVGDQGTYFGDGSDNRVVEVDRSGGANTSSWRQTFEIGPDDVEQTRELTIEVGDRNGQADDIGGLLVRIADPGNASVPLTGVGGAGFSDEPNGQLSVDALQTGSFATAVIEFTPSVAGTHTLQLVEQTDGPGLGDGGGIIIDDVVVAMIQCP